MGEIDSTGVSLRLDLFEIQLDTLHTSVTFSEFSLEERGLWDLFEIQIEQST